MLRHIIAETLLAILHLELQGIGYAEFDLDLV
jgi:hypothetical protein